MYSSGLIRGMAVITRGEALGHDLWIDSEFLQQVADGINASPNGVKARFTHPGLSGDGLGKYLGRARDAVIDGDVVRADLHLAQTAHDTPDGDLAKYVMGLAAEDPESFGQSVAFRHDFDAEDLFLLENGGDEFESPDPNNEKNYPHARLASMHAVDSVDDPAANPGGMFRRGQDVAADAEELLSYSLGLSDVKPELAALDIDPERVKGFAQRFLNQHGLSLVPQEKTMPKLNAAPETGAPADDKSTENKTDEQPAGEAAPAEGKTETTPASTGEQTQASAPAGGTQLKSDGQKFLTAFGEKGGVWFAQGKTFEEATHLHIEAITAENKELKTKLAAVNRGEHEPLTSTAESGKKDERSQKFENRLGKNMGRLAAGIKLPGNN